MKIYKVAVCFRGLIRTGVHNSRMFHNLLDHPQLQVDYFAHTWNMDNSAPAFLDCMKRNTRLWHRLREDTTVELSSSKIEKFTQCYKLKYFKVEDIDVYRNLDNNYTRLDLHGKWPMEFHPQYCSVGEADKLRREWERKTKTKYDVVISTRPDLVLDPTQKEYFLTELLSAVNDENYVGIGNLLHNWTVKDSWCDDVMYIGSSKSATVLGNFFDRNQNRESHQYLLKYLFDNQVSIKALPIRYTVLRDYCSFLDPLEDFNEIAIQNLLFYDSEPCFFSRIEGDLALKKHYEKRTY